MSKVEFPKKPFTVREYADRVGVGIGQANSRLQKALKEGKVTITGTKKSQTRGRPPRTFTAA